MPMQRYSDQQVPLMELVLQRFRQKSVITDYLIPIACHCEERSDEAISIEPGDFFPEF